MEINESSRSSGRLDDVDSLWNPQDPAGSELAFRALLPEARQLAGAERAQLILLLSWIGRAEALQRKFAEARRSLDEAGKLLEEPGAQYAVAVRIGWLIGRGHLHILEKTPSQARAFFSEAWSLATESGEDYFAVEIAQLMAVSEPAKSQREWISRAIQIAEKSQLPKTKACLCALYSSLGWKHFEMRQFENSLESFKTALESAKSVGSELEAFTAQWSIGKVLRAMSRFEEALAIQKKLVDGLGIGGRKNGRLYEEMAECLHALKRVDEAQMYFELAYRELSSDEWISDNQPVQLKRMKDLGKVKGPNTTVISNDSDTGTP